MKFTTRGRYGLRAAFVLAQGWGGPPVALKDIAASQHLAEKYLEQLLSALKKGGAGGNGARRAGRLYSGKAAGGDHGAPGSGGS